MEKLSEKPNTYKADIQSEVKTRTRQRILEAVRELFLEKWIDQLTLLDVSQRAGVTVQTLLRHFGSRELLILTAVEEIDLGGSQCEVVPHQGDLQSIIKALTDYYEIYGLWILRAIAQEDRFSQLNNAITRYRLQHREWVQLSFEVYLRALSPQSRQLLEDQLYSLTEVYLWRIYRIDLGKSREILENTWIRMLRSLLQSYR